LQVFSRLLGGQKMSVIYLIRVASVVEPNPEKHPDALKLTEQYGHALKRRINDEPLKISEDSRLITQCRLTSRRR